MDFRRCKGECGLKLPLSSFNLRSDKKALRNHCRKCHSLMTNRSERKRKFMEFINTPSSTLLKVEQILVMLERLIILFEQQNQKPIGATTKIPGCTYPLKNGIKIYKGNVGILLDYQIPGKRIRKSLSMDPLFHIAKGLELAGVEILTEGLPELDPKKLKPLLQYSEFFRVHSRGRKNPNDSE